MLTVTLIHLLVTMTIISIYVLFCLPLIDEENMNPHSVRAYHPRGGKDDELSTLPSPSSSVVDLVSNAGTVETEVLLSSYKGSHTSASGTVYAVIADFTFN